MIVWVLHLLISYYLGVDSFFFNEWTGCLSSYYLSSNFGKYGTSCPSFECICFPETCQPLLYAFTQVSHLCLDHFFLHHNIPLVIVTYVTNTSIYLKLKVSFPNTYVWCISGHGYRILQGPSKCMEKLRKIEHYPFWIQTRVWLTKIHAYFAILAHIS